ncbi:GGDEF domain-containing protein [Lysinibacillus fusiformis]|nr:GGDEF domain-containing protein [Lysinibacillus fusiformis]
MKFGTNNTLGYRGRVISLLFVGILILFIRIVVIHQFGEPPHKLPVPAIIALIVAWQIGKFYDRSVYLTMKDSLTDLYNRRFVKEKFVKLAKYATKRGLKIAVLISDVNEFKKINDRYGHDYGDTILLNIANSLKASFHKQDIIARWGGDEFLILSIYSNEGTIKTKIDTFQSNLNSMPKRKTDVSVSIGKANYPTDHTNLEELISLADANMYEIKLNYREKNN